MKIDVIMKCLKSEWKVFSKLNNFSRGKSTIPQSYTCCRNETYDLEVVECIE